MPMTLFCFNFSTASAGELRTSLNVFTDYVTAHKLVLNVNKSEINMFFLETIKKKEVQITCIPFFVYGTKLEIIDTFNYLGCILCDLDNSDDILKCLIALNRSFVFLIESIALLIFKYCIFCFYPFLPTTKLWFYWTKCKEAFNKIAVSFHCALNRIVGIHKFL